MGCRDCSQGTDGWLDAVVFAVGLAKGGDCPEVTGASIAGAWALGGGLVAAGSIGVCSVAIGDGVGSCIGSAGTVCCVTGSAAWLLSGCSSCGAGSGSGISIGSGVLNSGGSSMDKSESFPGAALLLPRALDNLEPPFCPDCVFCSVAKSNSCFSDSSSSSETCPLPLPLTISLS